MTALTFNGILVRALIVITVVLGIVVVRGRLRNKGAREPQKPVGAVARWLLPSIGSFSVLLVLCLLVACSDRFLLDSDTGWHIRTGDLIWQTHAAPRVDMFSFTMQGREWFAWEWLADAMMSALHSARGLAGLIGAAISLLCLSYAVLHRTMLHRGADPLIAAILTLFAAVASIVHWLARPHLLSIGLMIVWCAIIESYRRRRSRWIYAAPALIVLWANLHGAFVVTFAMLGVYALGEILEFWSRHKQRDPELRRVVATYIAVAALSALAALATPFGLKLFGHLWQFMNDRQLLGMVNEFQSPNFHLLDGKLIELMLGLGVVAAVQSIRKRRFVEVGLILFWSHMTLQSERHVTLAVVVLLPIVSEQITALIGEMVNSTTFCRGIVAWYRGVLAMDRQLNGGAVYLAIAAFLIVLVGSPWADNLLSPHFDDKRFPVAAANFIATANLTGNPYSYDQYGGYLIYRLSPKVKVFLDGRLDFYRQSTVLEDAIQISTIKPDWQSLLDKYDIGWMLLRRDESLASVAPITGQWVSVYSDATAVVLVRKRDGGEPR